MKKYFVICAAFCAALAMTGCKSSESAYKKAYEKAKAQETTQPVETQQAPVNVVAPVETKRHEWLTTWTTCRFVKKTIRSSVVQDLRISA